MLYMYNHVWCALCMVSSDHSAIHAQLIEKFVSSSELVLFSKFSDLHVAHVLLVISRSRGVQKDPWLAYFLAFPLS